MAPRRPAGDKSATGSPSARSPERRLPAAALVSSTCLRCPAGHHQQQAWCTPSAGGAQVLPRALWHHGGPMAKAQREHRERSLSDLEGGWRKRKEFVRTKVCREAENSINTVRKVFQQDVEVFRIFDCDESSWRKGARRHDGSRAFR
ncbi:hypothetical protein V5799_017037 [Amblyomma americanum]|uniref:Uncharacterized protein n=1 Tax=Amblyomma americanum TaxID=6943 RepID=A0AAQ4F3E0_AMBAM